MTPAAIVFDCDGLLLDTESAWTRAETRQYAQHGVSFGPQHKRELLGTSGAQAAATVERHLALPGQGPQLLGELHELVLDEVAREAEAMPGARELVAALRGRLPLGLASNSPRAIVDHALATSGFAESFDVVLSADEVEHPKPAPDIYLEMARRLGVEPQDALALEDSPTGVAAAVAARMTVIGVPSLEGVDLSAAHVVAPSLRDPQVLALAGLAEAAA